MQLAVLIHPFVTMAVYHFLHFVSSVFLAAHFIPLHTYKAGCCIKHQRWKNNKAATKSFKRAGTWRTREKGGTLLVCCELYVALFSPFSPRISYAF